MKNMWTRKIILLSAIAVLLAVYICQLALGGKNKVKMLILEEPVDSVTITNGDVKLSISKDGENWFVEENGKGKLPCQLNRANGIVNAINEIKVLGSVASGSDADKERYGLDHGIYVEAYVGEKLLRTLSVGKNTATGRQCYATIDGKNAVNLVQGALRSTFEITADEIIEKEKEADDSEEKNTEPDSVE